MLAETVGACNTFWSENGADASATTPTCDGLLRGAASRWSRRRAPWLIVGTGGGARAAVVAAGELRRGGRGRVPRRRTARRAFERWVADAGSAGRSAAECRVLINATPLGLAADDPLPLEPSVAPEAEVALRHGVRAPARRRGSARCAPRAAAPPTAAACWWRRVRAALRALVSRRATRRSRSCAPRWMPRFAERLAGWRRRWPSVERWLLPAACLLCEAPVAGRRRRRADLRALPAPLAAGAAARSATAAASPRSADLECRICADWPPGLSRVRSAVWLEELGARRGAPAQVRGLVAGRGGDGRGDARRWSH